jgi:anti-sigma regulatory factor (Ser/Thr protein kinase)
MDPRFGGPRIGLPAGLEAPTVARQFAAQVLDGFSADVLDDVALVVSELVSNAILHGDGARWVCVDPDDGVIQVAVADRSRQPASSVVSDPTDAVSRSIVRRLSVDWGVEHGEDGKVTWSVLDRR